jgi:lipoprotein-anchoring transpeptidase ErfK/SrfK
VPAGLTVLIVGTRGDLSLVSKEAWRTGLSREFVCSAALGAPAFAVLALQKAAKPLFPTPAATASRSLHNELADEAAMFPTPGGTRVMLKRSLHVTAILALLGASPAVANNPLDSGPLADFLNIFHQSAIPRQQVIWTHGYEPGTAVISTSRRRLYYVLGKGQALEYGVGVGRQGFSWAGTKVVSTKREWPDWTPPPQMLKRRPDLPRHMAGGIDNPLGARAIYLGSSLYRIHGSNEPDTIGAAVSSGCIRMTNDDVVDLYNRVKVGTKVVVLR